MHIGFGTTALQDKTAIQVNLVDVLIGTAAGLGTAAVREQWWVNSTFCGAAAGLVAQVAVEAFKKFASSCPSYTPTEGTTDLWGKLKGYIHTAVTQHTTAWNASTNAGKYLLGSTALFALGVFNKKLFGLSVAGSLVYGTYSWVSKRS